MHWPFSRLVSHLISSEDFIYRNEEMRQLLSYKKYNSVSKEILALCWLADEHNMHAFHQTVMWLRHQSHQPHWQSVTPTNWETTKSCFLLRGGRYYLFWGEKGEYYKQHEMWVSNGCRDLSINMEKWQLGANAQHIKALFMGFNRGSLDWTLDNWGLHWWTIISKNKTTS